MSTLKPFVDIRFWAELMESINSVIGLLLNSLLLYLIIWKTNFRMLKYRPILLQNCLVDVMYTLTEFIVRPIFALFYCLTSTSIQYIYRYFIIVLERKLKLLQYFGILAIPTIFATLYTLNNSLSFLYNPETHNFHEKQLLNDSFYVNGIPNFIVANIDSIGFQLQFLFITFFVTLAYIIIIYTNFKIYKKLLLMKNTISCQNFEFQRQLTITLFAQTIIPSIMCMIPVSFSAILTITKSNLPGFSGGIALVLSFIPVANPLTTIIIISQYRTICYIFIKTYFFPSKLISVLRQQKPNQIQILPT